jgi:hypothetical protein
MFIMANEKEKLNCKRKVRYANEPTAKAALDKINPARKQGKPYRAYRCQICAGYHLTTSAKL